MADEGRAWARMSRAGTILRTRAEAGLPERGVILTFDDGPNPRDRITERLLDALAAGKVRAAFCLVGRQARDAPGTVRRMAAEGHLIVNHTYSHGPRWLFSARALERQIDLFDRAVAEALGEPGWRSRHFRPPWGLLTPPARSVIARRRLRLVPVTDYAWDAGAGPNRCGAVTERILAAARRQDGGIFVIHDGRHRLLPWPGFLCARAGSGYNRSWVPDQVAVLIDRLGEEGFVLLDPHILDGD